MKASDKFTIGQRVKLSEEGITEGVGRNPNHSTGIVKGFPSGSTYRDPHVLVRVLRDGDRKPGTYHMDFWEVDGN